MDKVVKKNKEKTDNVKTDVKRSVQKKNAAQNTLSVEKLKLLITIVGRSKAEYYLDLIQSFDVNMQMVAMAQGTANEKMLGLLGLTNSEKAVIFSVIKENKATEALATIEEKFSSIKDGKGVAFTIALSSVIGALIYGFLSNNKLMVKEK